MDRKKAEADVELQTALARIKKVYGAEAIKTVGELPELTEQVISTGIEGLDKALGIGGIRKGSIVEICGTESAGKTTLAMKLAKQYQGTGRPVLYVDSECSLTKEQIKAAGIEPEGFYLLNESTLEKVFDICIENASAFGAIIIDSLAGLAADGQIVSSVGDATLGLTARIISKALSILTPILAKTNCTLIIVNQLRNRTGILFGNPEASMGGKALQYYETVKLDLRRVEIIKKRGEATGVRIRAKAMKNKLAAPFGETEFNIMFGQGIAAASA